MEGGVDKWREEWMNRGRLSYRNESSDAVGYQCPVL